MRLKHDKTLITGIPGVGKTTLVRKVIEKMQPVRMAGFYTAEIRPKGTRLGFELHDVNGGRRVLSHVDFASPHRVGKYGVDTAGFEDLLKTLELLNPDVELVVIDEIGKMELFSDRFLGLVRDVLRSDKQLLATIALKGGGFVQEIKQRPDVHLLELTRANRNRLPEDLLLGLTA